MAAADVTAAKEEDASHLHDLQTHLQLDAFDGKYLTKQEILLLELFQSFHAVRSHAISRSYLSDKGALWLILSLCAVNSCRTLVARMHRSSQAQACTVARRRMTRAVSLAGARQMQSLARQP